MPFIVITLILGFIQVWFNRFCISSDGISYLDMADAYMRGDWHTAINGYWNPLYSWIIGFFFVGLHPSMYWEYPTVQLVNFLIFCVTIAAFEYFLQGLLKDLDDPGSIRFIAYGLFLWTSLGMIRVWIVNPDMIVATVVYIAFGMLLRPHSKWTPVLLGSVLAAGYYAKSVMLPVGIMILLAGARALRRGQLFATGFIFALLVSPLVVAISCAEGHPSISETGALNYAWEADHVEARLWQGGPPRAGTPVHPPRIVLENPRVFEYSGVFPVTYPVWYDSSYWYKGLHAWWRPRTFFQNLFRNSKALALLLISQGGLFLVGLAFCLYKGHPVSTRWRRAWPLWAAAIGAIVLYCAVHCELRYLGSFFCVLFLIPFAVFDLRGKVLGAGIAVAGLLCAATFWRVTTYDGELANIWQRTPENTYWRVALEMQKLGLRPGDSIGLASGGDAMMASRWARLDRVHIISELDRGTDFWKLNPGDQQNVLRAFAAYGAKMAVSKIPSKEQPVPSGWVRVDALGICEHPL